MKNSSAVVATTMEVSTCEIILFDHLYITLLAHKQQIMVNMPKYSVIVAVCQRKR